MVFFHEILLLLEKWMEKKIFNYFLDFYSSESDKNQRRKGRNHLNTIGHSPIKAGGFESKYV